MLTKRKLIVLFFLILFFVLPQSTLAQTAQGIKDFPQFDTSRPFLTRHISKEEIASSDVRFEPNRFTSVNIRKGSFTQDVDLLVFKGDFNLLTESKIDYTPISPFYLVFLDSQGKEVAPLSVIDVFAYNNIASSDATFTTLKRNGGIPNTLLATVFKNQSPVRGILPQSDAGFIISVNKTIDEDNGVLTFATPDPSEPSTNNPGALGGKDLLANKTFIIVAMTLLLFLGVGLILVIIRSSRPQNKL